MSASIIVDNLLDDSGEDPKYWAGQAEGSIRVTEDEDCEALSDKYGDENEDNTPEDHEAFVRLVEALNGEQTFVAKYDGQYGIMIEWLFTNPAKADPADLHYLYKGRVPSEEELLHVIKGKARAVQATDPGLKVWILIGEHAYDSDFIVMRGFVPESPDIAQRVERICRFYEP